MNTTSTRELTTALCALRATHRAASGRLRVADVGADEDRPRRLPVRSVG